MVRMRTQQIDNGLSVVAVEQPHLHSVDVSLFVKCGSRYESERSWGLSHLLEHMLFRGSARFPDSRDLARAFERAGGTLQAATWRDHTHLSASVHPSRLAGALEALADVVQRPNLSDVEVERAVVEEELLSELDEHGEDTDINNVSRASVWGGHPMGRRIAGSLETVTLFGRDDLREHHEQHYVGTNMVLAVAGRVKADDVLRATDEAFSALRPGERTANGDAASFSPGSRIYSRRVEGTQLQIQLTFEALPDTHDDFLALTLLVRLLDDGAASRLRDAVCQQRGLVYELSTGLDCYADCGVLDIDLRVAPRRAATAVATTLTTLEQLCADGVGAEELALARELALAELEFSVDSPAELATHFGTGVLLGRPEPLEEQAERLQALTPDDLLRVARGTFCSGRLHATILGPVERANMKRIRSLLDHFASRSGSGIDFSSALKSRAVV